MALKTVTGKLTRADGTPIKRVRVVAKLSAQAIVASTQEVAQDELATTTGDDGTWSFTGLQSNLDLLPNDTVYRMKAGLWEAIVIVPQTAGPFKVEDIMTTVPPVNVPVAGHVASLLVDGPATFSAGPISLPAASIADAALSSKVVLTDTAQTVSGVKRFSAAPFFDAGFTVSAGQIGTFGTGDNAVYINANGVAQQLDIRQGTAASPVTSGSGPSVKISRTERILEASMPSGSGAANWGNAGIWAAIVGDALTEAQVNAGFFSAQTASTQSAHNDDALAVSAHGAIIGSGTGYAIAAYLEGRRETVTGKVNSLEIRVNNNTNTDGTYNPTGASDTMAVWLTPGATDFAGRVSGVGIQYGSVNGGQFDVGIGFSVIGGVSSIKTTSISDDSNATNSILISGTHTRSIGIKTGAGPILIGHTNANDAATNANALIEAFTTSVGARALISAQGSGVTAELSYKIGNSAGSTEWFVVGTAGHFLTGSAQGDSGLIVNTSGKAYHLGGTVKVVTVTNDDKLGFYAVAPVAQPAGTDDLLASLVNLGLRAASSNPPLSLGTGLFTGGGLVLTGTTSPAIHDSNTGATGLIIDGTHATSAIGIKTGSGVILIGHTNATDAATNANALIEAFTTTTTNGRALIAAQGSGASAELSYKIGNSSGSGEWFVVGTAGHFFTGTAQGDQGIIVNSVGKMFHLGGTTKVVTVTQDNKVGFFAAAPVAQQSGMPAAASDLATVITLANAIRTDMLNLGLAA